MTQKNKYRVIAEFTGKYSITVMCKFLSVPRSSYYYWLKSCQCLVLHITTGLRTRTVKIKMRL